MSVKNAITEEFYDQLGRLGKMELGDDKYKNTVDGVTKLADRIIELEKLENESKFKADTRETEYSLKMQLMNEEKRAQMIRNGIEGVKIVGGLGLAAWAFVASMNFEKEGTLTTEGGRNALRQLLKFVR